MEKRFLIMTLGCLALNAHGTVVDVTGVGVQKTSVAIQVADPDFARTLKRNLENSGLFTVQSSGAITVSGTVGGELTATGRGRKLSLPPTSAADGFAKRQLARRMSDEMCAAFENQKGFARNRLTFVKRNGANNGDVCVGYPDGQDIKCLTANHSAAVGPRWAGDNRIFFTGYRHGKPEIFELDATTGRCTLKWGPKGLATGAVVAPDGRRAAVIFSFQGNPELYVVDIASGNWTRLTNTPLASEGQPAWSPDGREIVYVSNEARRPQLYVVDVATRKSRRLTAKGVQNVDPEWGPNGLVTFITKSSMGNQVAVIDPARGASSLRTVTAGGTWEHPTWARDGRHLVASRDKSLFLVDTLEGGDQPKPLFNASGTWVNPSWSK